MSFEDVPFDLEKYDLIPDINNNPELNIFADVLTPLIKRVKKLSYGSIAIIIFGIRDILTGAEEDIPKEFYDTMVKVYYIMSGVLLSKKNINLRVTKKDLIELGNVAEQLLWAITTIESYYKSELTMEFKDGEWLVKADEKLYQSIYERGKEVVGTL